MELYFGYKTVEGRKVKQSLVIAISLPKFSFLQRIFVLKKIYQKSCSMSAELMAKLIPNMKHIQLSYILSQMLTITWFHVCSSFQMFFLILDIYGNPFILDSNKYHLCFCQPLRLHRDLDSKANCDRQQTQHIQHLSGTT